MATSTEIKQRANTLADKTDVNSITPKEVGGIMYDLASHGENVLRNGGTLGIRKVYESVAAMEADSTNPKDFWGDPIKKGNLVVIYDGTTTGVDNNKIYAFMKPGWELATKLDAAYATKAETDAKLSELGSYVENHEYIRAYTDADGRLLWGIKNDGSVEFAKGVPAPVKKYIEEYVKEIDRVTDEEVERINQLVIELQKDIKVLTDTYHYIANDEWLFAIVDKEGHILIGIMADGTYYIPNREMYNVTSSSEWLKAVVDSDGKILFGIYEDGTVFIPKGMSEETKLNFIEIKEIINELIKRISFFDSIIEKIESPEYLSVTLDNKGKMLEATTGDGKKIFQKQELLEKIDDYEDRLELTLDRFGKIISYRSTDGRLHEKRMSVEDLVIGNKLSFEGNSLTDLEQALIKDGFQVLSVGDWSNEKLIELPIPRTCAKVNITANRLPTSKTDNIPAIMSYWDKDGNYFKKKVVLNAQGSSSMNYRLKNMAIDSDDDTEYKFGNWVVQDSFHWKLYYIDVFRGMANICYNWCEEVIEYMQCRSNRFARNLDDTTMYNGIGSIEKDFDNGALCHPDGFPFELYFNGDYYGLYAWNLKKHRANYMMDKKDATSTILDGVLSSNSIWGGVINWTSFELRNPKSLVTMDGREYDADTNCNELIDESSEYYDSSNKDMVNSAITKAIVQKLSSAIPLLKNETDANSAKVLFESIFDKKMMMCYFICSQVVGNYDGFTKNWIWTIYNGGLAAPNFYDMDSCFGRHWKGNYVYSDNDSYTRNMLGVSTDLPTGQLYRLYYDELKEVYKVLRDKGVIDVDNIMRHFTNWIKRVGYDCYKRNIEKIEDIPSYRESLINEEYWTFDRKEGTEITYDEAKEYSVGETVYYGKSEYLKFTCKKQNIGQPPLLAFHSNYPYEVGMYDSPQRIKNWLIERIKFLDEKFEY